MKIKTFLLTVAAVTALTAPPARAIAISELVGTGDALNASGTVAFEFSHDDQVGAGWDYHRLRFYTWWESDSVFWYGFAWDWPQPEFDGYTLTGSDGARWAEVDQSVGSEAGSGEGGIRFLELVSNDYTGPTDFYSFWIFDATLAWTYDGNTVRGSGDWSYRTEFPEGGPLSPGVPDGGATGALLGVTLLALCGSQVRRRCTGFSSNYATVCDPRRTRNPR